MKSVNALVMRACGDLHGYTGCQPDPRLLRQDQGREGLMPYMSQSQWEGLTEPSQNLNAEHGFATEPFEFFVAMLRYYFWNWTRFGRLEGYW